MREEQGPLQEKLPFELGSAIEGRAKAREGYFVVNVTEPSDNPDADVFFPLGLPRRVDEHTIIPAWQLSSIAAIIHMGLQAGKKVFLHCYAGEERSPLVATWYLHLFEDLPLQEAFLRVKAQYPEAVNRIAWISYPSLEESLHNNDPKYSSR